MPDPADESTEVKLQRKKNGSLTQVNDYKILQPLGAGSYGEVYLCKRKKAENSRLACLQCCSGGDRVDEVLNQKARFALKVIPRGQVMRAEHDILIKVQHPNIVELLEYIDDTTCSSVFLVFEVLEGGPIARMTSEGRLEGEVWPEDRRSSDLFYQIGSGLQYLHQEGVVHRDIKPENIVFTADMQSVKIIDFGVSRIIAQGNDASTKTPGTPFFQAPETLQSCFFPDKAGDVWALGVLFYLLLVGHVPFGCGCKNRFQLWEEIQEGEPKCPMGKEPKSLIEQMLQKDTSRRITVPGVVAHYWLARERGSVVSSSSPSGLPIPTTPSALSIGTHVPHVQTSMEESGLSSILSLLGQVDLETRILIADDIHHERVVLTRMFEKLSLPDEHRAVTVYEVENGNSALTAIREAYETESHYHAVLVDIYLPDMDGFSLVRRIAEMEAKLGCDENVTVILMASQEERPPNFLELLQEHDLQDSYLTKPVHISKVRQILNWLGVRSKQCVDIKDLSRPNYIADEQYLENSLRRYTLLKKPSVLRLANPSTLNIDVAGSGLAVDDDE